MKRSLQILPFFFLLLLALPGFAQDDDYECPFPEEYFDTIMIIAPLPYNEETMTGGIPDSALACIDTPYEFTFAVSIPDTAIDFPGAPIPIVVESISFDPETAITYTDEDGNPSLESFSYVCDPPTCVFETGTKGCVKIFGTPTADDIGSNTLVLSAVADIGLSIDIEFPDPDLFPGSYTVEVAETGGENCLIAGVKTLEDELSIVGQPNPFKEHAQIILDAQEAKRYEFRVIDMLGQIHHREVVETVQGLNIINYDGSSLAPGMYFFNLTDGQAVLTKKMLHQ